MTESSKQHDIAQLWKKWEETAQCESISSDKVMQVPETRTDEFLDKMIDSFLYYDTDVIENHLDACMYYVFNNAKKKRSHIELLDPDTLYVSKIHAEEKTWRYVFGQTLLDIEVRVPTLHQIHECFVWRQKCFKRGVKIPRLRVKTPDGKENLDSVERMFLRQNLSQVYLHADMLYAPLTTWHEIVTRAPPQFKNRAVKREIKMLMNARVRRTFLARNKAPLFMIHMLDKEIFDIQAVLEIMSD